MISTVQRMWHHLVSRDAETSADSRDPRLRGRTYAIPFDRVWQASITLANGGLRGWRVVAADDKEGRIEAVSVRLLSNSTRPVRVDIRLDEDAQTRVDARTSSHQDRFDLGASGRRLQRFFRKLDHTLAGHVNRVPPAGDAAERESAAHQQ